MSDYLDIMINKIEEQLRKNVNDYTFPESNKNNNNINNNINSKNLTELKENNNINDNQNIDNQLINGGLNFNIGNSNTSILQETKNIIQKEMNPFSVSIRQELKTSLNNLENDIKSLENKNYEIDKIQEEINDLNNKTLEIGNNIAILKNDNKNNEELLKDILMDNKIKDDNVLNKLILV